MPRASKPRRGKKDNANDDTNNEEDASNSNNNNPAVNRQLPEAVRNRQRAVAEREAARLARPERRPTSKLGHADRKKSAVTSTPFGILNSSRKRKAGGENEEDDSEIAWCGPFSVARQMLAARDQAKRQREAEQLAEDDPDNPNNGQPRMNHPLDAVMAQVEEEKRQQAHPSLLWKSRVSSNSSVVVTPDTKSKKNKRGQRLPLTKSALLDAEEQHNRVPSLYKMCVDFVVTNFEHVESLGYGVDHDIRTSIAQTLASQNRLDAAALEALVTEGDAMEALELIDCADIPQESLVAAMEKCCYTGESTSTLKYLILDQAGRCFGPKAVAALVGPAGQASSAKLVPLFALHIGGAYLLTDLDAARLITAMAKTLQSLAWKACPLLGLQMCRSIPATYGSGSSTLLEFSLEDMTLDRESWNGLIGVDTVATAKKYSSDNTSWQRNLKSLTLRRVGGLQDDVVISLLQGAPDLEHVDLSDNHELTDACLSPLRRTSDSHDHSPSSLRSLALYNLKNITNLGLETLFTQDLMGMGPPPQLKRLNLNHMDVDAVTDEVMELILQSACRKPVTSAGAGTGPSSVSAAAAATVAHSGLSLLGGMVKVELQGAAITDNTLEQLAATSANTIEHLDVSFCPRISDKGLGYLVDSVGNQLENVQIWGCAQITEEFWNGHARVFEGGRMSITNSDVAPVVPLQITGAWMKRSGIASIRS